MAAHRLMKARDVPFPLVDIDILDAADEELMQISSDMGLNLSLDEMKTVREYFKAEGRTSTDVELQAIGQAWSEHCCYKSSKPILKEFVFSIARSDILSKGDAGVMVFDDEYGYALRIESHNHPSAIEPYGGAATGIGGILRDVICMGAQPIGLADPLCFGPLDYDGELPPGTKHPRYLANGVVSGIRDYGNRVGIPTITGGFFFDERYVGNCLVNVACLGIVKREDLAVNHAGGPGEVMILLGGRTGRDGIHGVNFASADLTSTSEEDSRGAVQLGDPITKEPLMHACLEVNSQHLITGMKDLGGGGLSCVVDEMALDGGCGADIELEKVPLKEEGLAPWEIWVSESQERMMVTAKPENVTKILEIFDSWDVLATPIGTTTEVPRTRLFWGGEVIFDMDLKFLTVGPVYNRPYVLPEVSSKEKEVFPDLPSDNEVILTLLSDLNVASKEWAIRQYDHEVRASTIVRPMVGRLNRTGPGDASVLMPVPGRYKGLAAAIGCNPWFTAADPYKGGKAAIDEACRNLVAVGARPNALTDCLNFGNPEKPERLGEFREAVRGIGELASALRIPIPSGNVSLYNEAPGGVFILPTPMVMGCGLIDDFRKSVTADIKEEGNLLFLIGETKDEMGASLLFRKYGGREGAVPDVDAKALRTLSERLLDAMNGRLVRSCHDCSDGGLAVATAEMCISGGIGARLDLSGMGDIGILRKLYSESNTRWIAEVRESDAEQFSSLLGNGAVCIGRTGGDSLLIPEASVDLSVGDLRKAWSDPIWKIMGGVKE
ncbi:MAG: phosphoribosylformylglycinamidine synthase subunit PurL [Candidatus Methanomethylophilaceae archaeon]|jgi:phosphoribosylformylglycinamidine synthase|nr:phosphoribosylformylglycinamidine synthase subunit PurL [Candidatus Methanomethylophilaceae archaeon]NLF34286.1 phosphoribosylformylglycinamidine synthase subunit PurL [Thermoplasmatales archaeon]